MAKAIYQSIGFTKKTYGVKGELKLTVEEVYLESLAQAEVLFLGIAGRKIPFFIDAIHFDNPLTIKLEEYDSKEAATELTGKEIFLRQADLVSKADSETVEDSLNTQTLVGFEIADKELGRIGIIEEIIELPQQEMAVIIYNGKETLIPLTESLVDSIDEDKRLIVMDLPEGLLDLNE